jgi:hypothetical protein
LTYVKVTTELKLGWNALFLRCLAAEDPGAFPLSKGQAAAGAAAAAAKEELRNKKKRKK